MSAPREAETPGEAARGPGSTVNAEGYLLKQGGSRTKAWKRRYFVLSDGMLTYFDEKPSAENMVAQRPRGIAELSGFSVVRASRSSKAFAFELVARPHVFVLRAESEEEAIRWESAILEAIEEAKHTRNERKLETRRGWLTKRAVHSRRNWRKRFFVLRNGRLAYYENKPTAPTDRPKGMFEITADAVVRALGGTMGLGKRNAFSVETGAPGNRHVLQVFAASAAEREAWIWVLHVAIVRKCGVHADDALKVGIWLHEHSLGKYVRGVVVDAGISSFDHIKRLSESDMKTLFRQSGFTLNDARRFQNAVKDLRALTQAQMDMLDAPLGVEGTGDLQNLADVDEDDIAVMLGESPSNKYDETQDEELQSLDDSGSSSFRERMTRSMRSSRRASQQAETSESSKKAKQSEGTGAEESGESSANDGSEGLDASPKAGLWRRLSASGKRAVLAPERRLYTWGDDSHHQLGVGTPSLGGLSAKPSYVEALKKKSEPKTVAAGETCMAIVTEREGQLFMWGSGPLGLRSKSSSSRPFLVTSLRKTCMVSVSIGEAHVGAVSLAGDLYMWGNGPNGELGLGPSRVECREPVVVAGVGSSRGLPVKLVACGPEHTVVVTESSLFTMGKGSHGRLGLGDQDNRFEPTSVNSLDRFNIGRVALGARFSLAVTADGTACFRWGSIASETGSLIPLRVPSFDEFDRPILDVAAASKVALFLVGGAQGRDTMLSLGPNEGDLADVETSVYAMGSRRAPLGVKTEEDLTEPVLVSALEDEHVSQLSCSSTHAAALTYDGRIFAWGSDHRGALGTGYSVSTWTPVACLRISSFRYKFVACGGHCTAAIGEFDEDFAPTCGAPGEVAAPGSIAAEGEGPPPLSVRKGKSHQDQKIVGQISEITQLLREVEFEPPPLVDNDGYPLPLGSKRYDDEWIEHKDPRTGKRYYENMDTREVQWETPQRRVR